MNTADGERSDAANAQQNCAQAGHFDRLYASHEDPYGVRHRWYEQRKMNVLLASLPRQRYERAFEPGCGVGCLTIELALRCRHVLASDLSLIAVSRARKNLAACGNVELRQQRVPLDWPSETGGFDLIVLSEVLSFLHPHDVARTSDLCARGLRPGGSLVACDWRPHFEGRTCGCDQSHDILGSAGLPRVLRHAEDDFLLDIWSHGDPSVARHEGVR